MSQSRVKKDRRSLRQAMQDELPLLHGDPTNSVTVKFWNTRNNLRNPLIVAAMKMPSYETCTQRPLDLDPTTLPCFFGAIGTGLCKNGLTPRTVGMPLVVGGMCDYHNEYFNEIEYCNQYVYGNKTRLLPFSCHSIAKNGMIWKAFPILCAQPLDSLPSDYIRQFGSRVPDEDIDAESYICALATSSEKEKINGMEALIYASMTAFFTDWLPMIQTYYGCWSSIKVNMYFTDKYLARKDVANNKWIRTILDEGGKAEFSGRNNKEHRIVSVPLKKFPVFDMLTIVKYQLAFIDRGELGMKAFGGVVTNVSPNVHIMDGQLVHGIGTGLKLATTRKMTYPPSKRDNIETLGVKSKSILVTPEPLYLDGIGPMHHSMPIGVFGSDPYCTTYDHPVEVWQKHYQERSSSSSAL